MTDKQALKNITIVIITMAAIAVGIVYGANTVADSVDRCVDCVEE